MRSTVVGILILVLAIGGWIVLSKDSPATPEINDSVPSTTNNDTLQTQNTPQSLEISYTSSGFFPKNLTIDKGDTVIFANMSNAKMWVASDPHPIHTDYSAFDSREDAKIGETYQFTFTETGEYSYHNHTIPNHNGTITVK